MLKRHFSGIECVFTADAEQSFYGLLAKKRAEDFIYVAGSLYLAGEVKALLRRKADD